MRFSFDPFQEAMVQNVDRYDLTHNSEQLWIVETCRYTGINIEIAHNIDNMKSRHLYISQI